MAGRRREGEKMTGRQGDRRDQRRRIRGLVGKREETEMVGGYSPTGGCDLALGPPSHPNTKLRLQIIIL